jgi:hypothetical protein
VSGCLECLVLGMQAQQREAQAARAHADQLATAAREQAAAAEADKQRCPLTQTRPSHKSVRVQQALYALAYTNGKSVANSQNR